MQLIRYLLISYCMYNYNFYETLCLLSIFYYIKSDIEAFFIDVYYTFENYTLFMILYNSIKIIDDTIVYYRNKFIGYLFGLLLRYTMELNNNNLIIKKETLKTTEEINDFLDSIN